jgi:hypothetical protein
MVTPVDGCILPSHTSSVHTLRDCACFRLTASLAPHVACVPWFSAAPPSPACLLSPFVSVRAGNVAFALRCCSPLFGRTWSCVRRNIHGLVLPGAWRATRFCVWRNLLCWFFERWRQAVMRWAGRRFSHSGSLQPMLCLQNYITLTALRWCGRALHLAAARTTTVTLVFLHACCLLFSLPRGVASLCIYSSQRASRRACLRPFYLASAFTFMYACVGGCAGTGVCCTSAHHALCLRWFAASRRVPYRRSMPIPFYPLLTLLQRLTLPGIRATYAAFRTISSPSYGLPFHVLLRGRAFAAPQRGGAARRGRARGAGIFFVRTCMPNFPWGWCG